MVAGMSEELKDLIVDLVRCPGLYAGQYKAIESLPHGVAEYRYLGGMSLMLGLPHAYPTDLARDLAEAIGY